MTHTATGVPKNVKVGDENDLGEDVRMGGVCDAVMRVGVLVCTEEDDGVKMV